MTVTALGFFVKKTRKIKPNLTNLTYPTLIWPNLTEIKKKFTAKCPTTKNPLTDRYILQLSSRRLFVLTHEKWIRWMSIHYTKITDFLLTRKKCYIRVNEAHSVRHIDTPIVRHARLCHFDTVIFIRVYLLWKSWIVMKQYFTANHFHNILFHFELQLIENLNSQKHSIKI